ncbi:MAG TPA: peroxiredoxin [Pseudonocardiaceae bacterium]|nr:peroxiredoxin [Pseudonocardiaceae bacterium]
MQAGDIAPDFELPDEQGVKRSLTELLSHGPVVLFFYPAAMTAGCTAESCHFRDLAKEFADAGAQRVGISPDEIAKQAEFSARNSFDFPLLSDPDGAVATQFGVRRKIAMLATRRMTFVIDTDRKILDVIKSEVRMSMHADKALAALATRG